MQPFKDRSYKMGPVSVTRHWIDWRDLDPEFRDLAGMTFRRFEAIPRGSTDHHYLTPGWTVTAPGSVPEAEFLKQARRACTLWMKQLIRVAGGRRIRRFQRHESGAGERNLVTSGILFLQGRVVHTRRLHRGDAPPPGAC